MDSTRPRTLAPLDHRLDVEISANAAHITAFAEDENILLDALLFTPLFWTSIACRATFMELKQ